MQLSATLPGKCYLAASINPKWRWIEDLQKIIYLYIKTLASHQSSVAILQVNLGNNKIGEDLKTLGQCKHITTYIYGFKAFKDIISSYTCS